MIMLFIKILIMINMSNAAPVKVKAKLNTKAKAVAKLKVKAKELEKAPKSLFLIKKAKINADVAEPQFNPTEAQLRTVINDRQLHDIKKFQ